MNKKTVIFLTIAIIVLLAGVGVAIMFLYSDTSGSRDSSGLELSDSSNGLFQAVPSDAVALMRFDDLKSLSFVLGGADSPVGFMSSSDGFGKFISGVYSKIEAKEIHSIRSSRALLSFHYGGSLMPLLIIDAGRSGATLSEDVYMLRDFAGEYGLYTSSLDCSKLAEKGTYLEKRQLLLISSSESLLKSSERHISQSISVVDHDGFASAASVSYGIGQLYISNANIGKLMSEVLNSGYRKYADFSRRISDWIVLSFDQTAFSGLSMSGTMISGHGNEKFLNVFRNTSVATSKVADVLPSYTVSAFSVPLADVNAYLEAYLKFADTKMGEAKYKAAQKALQNNVKIAPSQWAEILDFKEIAQASFYVGDRLENVLLLRPGNIDVNTIFRGLDVTSVKQYVPAVHDFVYSGFASSLFGSLFSADDESKFTYMKGWIIAGSESAVNEYVSGVALENTLASYLSGADLSGRADTRNLHFFGYMSMTENSAVLDQVFRKEYASALKSFFADAVFAPGVMKIGSSKGDNTIGFTLDRVSEIKSNAPVYERDTVVVVPTGPFKVKNSGTGKTNSFYQRSNMYLCLEDENGKGLWGAPFSTPICGNAVTVDYFANGKLQILFASGSKLYLIDRLGRFVSPFPVDLGKEILIGPDVYDFSGARKYNVMVLHKDNTIDMYNLQGRKPADWKGIRPSETIKGLPEEIKVGGKTYWAVRTSLQTLIYPFYGGEPLTSFEGNRKIRPDSAVTPVKGGVEVTRYDGKKVTVELKP